MNRPLMYLVLALTGGIILGSHMNIQMTLALIAALLAWLAAGIGILRTWRHNPWVLFCACVTLGSLLVSWQLSNIEPMDDYHGKSVKVIGTVIDYPDIRPDGVFYNIKLSRLEYSQKVSETEILVRVKIQGQGKVYKYGSILKLQGRLSVPEPPGNPGAFDYRAWLSRQGISATIFVKEAADASLLGLGGNPGVIWAYKFRESLEQIFDQTMPITQAAVLKGIILGTRGEIPRQVQLAFNETGLVHILSVSGYHVGLVVALVLTLIRLFRVPSRYVAITAIPVIMFYALMTGLGPPVFRSAIMAALLLIAHHFGREQDWPTTLLCAAGIILVYKPLSLFDIGFQLSFIATWGLLYLTPRLSKFFPSMPKGFAMVLFIPLAAQLATMPLVILYFNLVSPVSILANLLTIHLIALLMLFGGIALTLGTIHLPLAAFINIGTGFLTDIFLWLVKMCAALPGAAWYIPTPPLWGIGLYYVLLVGVIELIDRPELRGKLKEFIGNGRDARGKYFTFFSTVLLLLLIVWCLLPPSRGLQVHFIDVGQGDSILIISPEGRRILVDTGGWKDELVSGRGAGEQVVVPYLHRLGINSLDTLILTHPHEDHVGGARAVIESMPVHLVLVSPYGLEPGTKNEEGYEQLLRDMEELRVIISPAWAGDVLKIETGLSLTVLSPEEIVYGTRSDANNNSLVFMLNYHRRSILFTGDIESEAQRKLIDQQEKIENAEILKIPHHGSGYFEPDFFIKINPKVAVIQVGASNNFGHPSKKTLEALEELSCKVYRTDRDGAVILSTKGDRWSVKTGRSVSTLK